MAWSRPGPPQIWRDIKLKNSHGKEFEFRIQDITKERYDEVMDHMCSDFCEDEAVTSSIGIKSDPASMAHIRLLWNAALNQGVSIAAFEKSEGGNLKLAGLNVLTVVNDEFEEGLKSLDISHLKFKSFFEFLFSVSEEGDVRPLYKVDSYLGAFGLSVRREYRGLGLGKYLLETRNDIGRMYNIAYTSTFFTSTVAQKIAASAGFTDYVERAYDDILDGDGNKLFPSLTGKSSKIMIKKLL